jgi:hypothetical protein
MDRKLHTYLEDNDSAIGLEQNFLCQNYAKIILHNSMNDALSNTADILLVNLDIFSFSSIDIKNFKAIILLKSGRFLNYEEVLSSDFLVTVQNDKFIVLNKKPSN